MKNIFIAASCFAAVTCFTACDDWTEVENVKINTPGVEELNPEQYAKYLQNLVEYKNSDHKVVYAWFDNSEKVPFSRGQHISDAPDSLDVISMMYPAELAEFERTDMETVRAKGTKVVYTISFDKIQKEYTDKVKEGTESGTFDAYLSAELTKQIGYADDFDGIIAGYVYRWRERNGLAYSVEKPASVAFDIHLYRAGDGALLWRGLFDQTQASLMEDMLQIPFFFKEKGRWLTAEELTAAGMEMRQPLKVDGRGEGDHCSLVKYYEKLAHVEVKR